MQLQDTEIQYLEKHTPELYNDVCQIIDDTRSRLATTVNAETCLLHWHVGKRIKEDVLYNKRAEYGKEIVKNLAERLTQRYGRGWSDRKLLHCIRAAYTFTEDEIVYAVRTQLSWTHLRSLMYIDDELKRKFYMEMARMEHWDTRVYNGGHWASDFGDSGPAISGIIGPKEMASFRRPSGQTGCDIKAA